MEDGDTDVNNKVLWMNIFRAYFDWWTKGWKKTDKNMDNGIVNSFLNVVASCISDYHSFKENHQEIREEELKNNRVEKSNFVSLS